MKTIIPTLAILPLPLAAQGCQITQSGFITLNLEAPIRGLIATGNPLPWIKTFSLLPSACA